MTSPRMEATETSPWIEAVETSPRNTPGAWDFFLSHTQRDADAKVIATDLYYSLQARGFAVWLDVKMNDRSEAAMREGVERSTCVVAIITGDDARPDDAYFARPFCVQELRWALAAGVRLQPVGARRDSHNDATAIVRHPGPHAPHQQTQDATAIVRRPAPHAPHIVKSLSGRARRGQAADQRVPRRRARRPQVPRLDRLRRGIAPPIQLD